MNPRVSLGLRAAGGALLVLLASVIGVDSVLASRSPEVALAAWPFSAEARAALSARLLRDNPTSPDLPRVRELASAALAREPIQSGAAVSLAVAAIAEGQRQAGTRDYVYAERLSRRNVGAQLLLIEQRVAQNDVAGALVHYDRALRVSPRGAEMLLPVLVAASANAPVAQALGPLLRARPPWWTAFYDRLVATGTPQAVLAVTRAAALDPQVPAERVRLGTALQALVNANRFDMAHALYSAARAKAGSAPLIADGSFEAEPELVPFEWWLANDADLAAVREPRDGADGGFALSLIRSSGRSGEVANQLLRLPAGTYRLSGRAGSIAGVAGSGPRIALRCAGGGPVAGEIRLADAPETGKRFAASVTIPADCPFVWLALSPGDGLEAAPSTAWIDGLALTRN